MHPSTTRVMSSIDCPVLRSASVDGAELRRKRSSKLFRKAPASPSRRSTASPSSPNSAFAPVPSGPTSGGMAPSPGAYSPLSWRKAW